MILWYFKYIQRDTTQPRKPQYDGRKVYLKLKTLAFCHPVHHDGFVTHQCSPNACEERI